MRTNMAKLSNKGRLVFQNRQKKRRKNNNIDIRVTTSNDQI